MSKHHFLQSCDITQPSNIELAIKKIQSKFSKIDIWINNAGIGQPTVFAEQTPNDLQKIVELNILSVLSATNLVLNFMNKQCFGTVINISSVAGHVPAPYLATYCATKAAVLAFTRALQQELKFEGSTVQLKVFSPGFVQTKMIDLGQKNGLPDWLKFLITSPEKTAKDLVRFSLSKKRESIPSLNGKIMKNSYKVAPIIAAQSSKLLLSNSLFDALRGKFNRPS